ncbi:MAG: hypothetical protein MOB07_05960, partial [Acidobacteria bacterium]|nr:hypothetical protein [Acidobacteriota bacterium]
LASTLSRGDHGAGWKPAPHHLLPNLPYTGQVGNLPATPPVAKFAVYAIANRSKFVYDRVAAKLPTPGVIAVPD